jgi:HSP20 family protein
MSNLVKYNSLNRNLLDIVNDFHDAFWGDPVFQLERNWRPTDVITTDTEYKVEVELPRFRKEEIRVEVVKNTLQISAKNARSSYVRSFSLSDADFDKSNVKLEDGVLTVTIPKLESSKSKVLEIK